MERKLWRHSVPEWADMYVDYAGIKKWIGQRYAHDSFLVEGHNIDTDAGPHVLVEVTSQHPGLAVGSQSQTSSGRHPKAFKSKIGGAERDAHRLYLVELTTTTPSVAAALAPESVVVRDFTRLHTVEGGEAGKRRSSVTPQQLSAAQHSILGRLLGSKASLSELGLPGNWKSVQRGTTSASGGHHFYMVVRTLPPADPTHTAGPTVVPSLRYSDVWLKTAALTLEIMPHSEAHGYGTFGGISAAAAAAAKAEEATAEANLHYIVHHVRHIQEANYSLAVRLDQEARRLDAFFKKQSAVFAKTTMQVMNYAKSVQNETDMMFLREEIEELKEAFHTVHYAWVQLEYFADHNVDAIMNLVRKIEQRAHFTVATAYRQWLVGKYAFASEVEWKSIDKLRVLMENVLTETVCRGNKKEASKVLHFDDEEQKVDATIFKTGTIGLLVGALGMMLVFTAVQYQSLLRHQRELLSKLALLVVIYTRGINEGNGETVGAGVTETHREVIMPVVDYRAIQSGSSTYINSILHSPNAQALPLVSMLLHWLTDDVNPAILFSLIALLLLLALLFSINVIVWSYSHINFAFIFDLDGSGGGAAQASKDKNNKRNDDNNNGGGEEEESGGGFLGTSSPTTNNKNNNHHHHHLQYQPWTGPELMTKALRNAMIFAAFLFIFIKMKTHFVEVYDDMVSAALGVVGTELLQVTTAPPTTTAAASRGGGGRGASNLLPVNIGGAVGAVSGVVAEAAGTVSIAVHSTSAGLWYALSSGRKRPIELYSNDGVTPLFTIVPMAMLICLTMLIVYDHLVKPTFWLCNALARTFVAPLAWVTFSDFFIADQLTSLTGCFFELQFVFCLFHDDSPAASQWASATSATPSPHAHESHRLVPKTSAVVREGYCNSLRAQGLPYLAFLPHLWRFLQCCRRYYDDPSRNFFPHVANALKYLVGMMQIFSAFTYRQARYHATLQAQQYAQYPGTVGGVTAAPKSALEHAASVARHQAAAIHHNLPGLQGGGATNHTHVLGEMNHHVQTAVNNAEWIFWIWVFWMIMEFTFKSYWDIVVDAGLCTYQAWRDGFGVLRSKIFFPKNAYYRFIIINVICRLNPLARTFGVRWFGFDGWFALFGWSAVEVIRRFIWNFFRMENEQATNPEKYREIALVPPPRRQPVGRKGRGGLPGGSAGLIHHTAAITNDSKADLSSPLSPPAAQSSSGTFSPTSRAGVSDGSFGAKWKKLVEGEKKVASEIETAIKGAVEAHDVNFLKSMKMAAATAALVDSHVRGPATAAPQQQQYQHAAAVPEGEEEKLAHVITADVEAHFSPKGADDNAAMVIDSDKDSDDAEWEKGATASMKPTTTATAATGASSTAAVVGGETSERSVSQTSTATAGMRVPVMAGSPSLKHSKPDFLASLTKKMEAKNISTGMEAAPLRVAAMNASLDKRPPELAAAANVSFTAVPETEPQHFSIFCPTQFFCFLALEDQRAAIHRFNIERKTPLVSAAGAAQQVASVWTATSEELCDAFMAINSEADKVRLLHFILGLETQQRYLARVGGEALVPLAMESSVAVAF